MEILYDAEVLDLEIDNGMFLSATLKQGDGRASVRASTLVAAAGGFEANIEWLKEYSGEAADNFLVRGTPYNRGSILKMLLAKGVQEIGDPTQCHAVAIDARAPKFDGGIITRHDFVVFGIVVNKHAQRFYDEGEDIWPKRYAIWGRLVAAQPDQIAYIIFDSSVVTSFMPTLFPPIGAPSVAELAAKLELDPSALEKTVADFNAAVQPGTFDHTILDDCRTEGITPPKTHWARRSRRRHMLAYPVRPGITFTYLGTRVNKQARMVMKGGKPAANMFAAGEIMAGNVLGKGYPGRHRHDHRQRVRSGSGTGSGDGRKMHGTRILEEADRLMTVCNSCRYCEGLCAVFPAMEMRRAFADGDLNYLANLCHSCGACYTDCQFSPPRNSTLMCRRRSPSRATIPMRPIPGRARSPAPLRATVSSSAWSRR